VTLVEPIKAELGLSDFSIAFLSGALAFFYVTACCGIVQNYGQMLAARGWALPSTRCGHGA
jgi:hypothetical protein